ncbi:hypothetical protein [Mesorhizobium sp.]|jgi:hypothetical protein|uniref:hypothetical protein n=1 Tax=Mesorhizobium sp. TaxID=1871066 RepID=UPI00356617A6
MIRRILPALVAIGLAAFPLLTGPVRADEQKAQQLHVRGTVETLGASVLKVKTREGETVDVTLADGWKVAAVARAQVADIKPGDFVGIASMPKAEGGDGALEVLIFPPALRGAGEGSYGWDLKPKSSMTNATVANAVKDIQGRTLTVSYNGQQKKIAIPDGTPVVTLAAATKDDLVPGAVVFIIAEKAAEGVLGRQIIVGKDGVVPPM